MPGFHRPPSNMPPELTGLLAGYKWRLNPGGQSGGAVYRLLAKKGAPDLFLKFGVGPVADDLMDEAVRLRWMASHLCVPKVLLFHWAPDAAWLLTTAVQGETAYILLESRTRDRTAIVDALARFLLDLHAVRVGTCPFRSDPADRIARGRVRIDAGLVDTTDFDEERAGWSAEDVWEAMQAIRPGEVDAVVTHGDYSLDNVLIDGGVVSGCIDVGRAGVADRYQDLAIMWNNLGEFGPALQRRFLRTYGIAKLDRRKLDFHLMLDELF